MTDSQKTSNYTNVYLNAKDFRTIAKVHFKRDDWGLGMPTEIQLPHTDIIIILTE